MYFKYWIRTQKIINNSNNNNKNSNNKNSCNKNNRNDNNKETKLLPFKYTSQLFGSCWDQWLLTCITTPFVLKASSTLSYLALKLLFIHPQWRKVWRPRKPEMGRLTSYPSSLKSPILLESNIVSFVCM